jgi:hypothetical protein
MLEGRPLRGARGTATNSNTALRHLMSMPADSPMLNGRP